MGIAAALCLKYNCNPRELHAHIPELQQILLKHDGFLPNVRNTDELDLARQADFFASSYKENCEPQKVVDGVSRKLGTDMHGWVSDGISKNGESLTMKWKECKKISELRYTFHSDFSYPIRVTMAPPRQKQQREGVPAELVRDYEVILKNKGEIIKTIGVQGNHQRHNVHTFEPVVCDAVELIVKATNGANEVTVFEVRAY